MTDAPNNDLPEMPQDIIIEGNTDVVYKRGQTPYVSHIDESPFISETTVDTSYKTETTFSNEPVVDPLPELLGPVNKQKLTIEGAILKVEKINSYNELLMFQEEFKTIPVAGQKDFMEYLTANSDAMMKLHNQLRNKREEAIKLSKESGGEFPPNHFITEAELYTLLSIQTHTKAMMLEDNNLTMAAELSREGSNWLQRKGPLQLGRPVVSKAVTGTKLSGAQALSEMRSAVGLANGFWWPLYNSGFWINLEAPNDYDLVLLTQKIGQEKTALGTETAGGVFANSSCFIRRHIVELLGSKIIGSSLKTDTDPPRALKGHEIIDRIEITDYPEILTRFMSLKHNKGYQYIHTCSNYTKPCNSSHRLTLSLHNLSIHDFSRLSAEQEAFMISARAQGSVAFGTPDDVIAPGGEIKTVLQYRNAFAYRKNNVVRLTEKLDIVYKTPSITDTITEGDVWMNSIRKDIDDIIANIDTPIKTKNGDKQEFEDGNVISAKEIDRHIENLINISGVRRYSQWIDSVKIYNTMELEDGSSVRDNDQEPNYVEGRKDIYNFLTDIISDETLIDIFMEGYNKYSASACMTIVGYPQFECPSCGSLQGTYEEKDNKRLTHALIPFEAEENFFILLQG